MNNNTLKNTHVDFLSGGGEMGKLIRSKDWSKTALGSPDSWPQSLRTTVSLCIASNFPISIAWGPHRVQIYNDGYWPITGDKHPVSMGQDFKECWLPAWPVIGQAFEEASLGQTRFLENQRIFIDRYGYLEETFFTFSFSPILDESGGVGGLFHPVTELTQQTLTERRLNILRALTDSTVNAKTVAEASSLIMECLKDFELDLPFLLLYSITTDGKEANLQGSVCLESGSPIAPGRLNLQEEQAGSWPFKEAIAKGAAVTVEELSKMFGTFTCGPYPEQPNQALLLPLTIPGKAYNDYLLVAGVSSRRRLDEKYLIFYDLLKASITNALTKARAYEEERKKAEALAEIDKAKTVFFSNISHEFRTPLTLMLNPLEELINQKNSNFSEIEKGNLETTHRNAVRLLKLVNTLLEFSRIESGRVQAVFSLVDIGLLTTNFAANFRSVIEKAGLKLLVKADSIIQPVYVDKQMWEKIVFNLLSNAFKYTLKGTITVELLTENEFAVLKVTDTGVGIPEAELPKMFERFHRVQNVAGRTYEGTGIGLSLIKEMVHMHRGTIQVESKLNEGSIFSVKIPTGKKHIDEQQILTKEIDSDDILSVIYVNEIEALLQTQNAPLLNTPAVKEQNILPIILVVDDNADMREHIRSILAKSFHVVTASNGMDALHKIEEDIPALVLSDIMMPVMDGIGLLKEIKSNKATANIPVIFLTARAGEESKIEGLETGADDYLVKPFSSKELLARINAQIKITKLRQSLEDNVRNLFMDAPACICVLRGIQHVYELANEMYLQVVGNRDILGKPIREALPEMEGQGFFELLDDVYTTGKPFIGNEMPVKLNKGNGKLEDSYFNFVYQPSHNTEGKIDGILVHGVDITEQVLARKKIEESEKRFSNLLMESPFAFAILKGDDMVVSLANDAIKSVWGKGSELEGKSIFTLMPEIKEQKFATLLAHVYTTGKPFYGHEELAKLERNGIWEDVYFNFIYQPYREADETISGVTIIANEVTTEAIANKKIVATKENVSKLFMQAPAIICVLRGPQHIYELANAMYLQLVGYRDIVGKPIRDALPELEGTGIFEILDVVYTTGEPFIANELPVSLLRESGKLEEGFFNFIYQASHDADGHTDGILVHAIEVTEQLLSRKKIEESEQYFRQLTDTVPAIIWITEPDGNCSYLNQNWYDYTGQTEAQAKGFGWLDATHPDDKEDTGNIFLDANAKRKSFSASYRLKVKSGGYRWAIDKGSPKFSEEGVYQGMIGTVVDVHEEKLAAEKIRDSEKQFSTLANNIQNLAWIADGEGRVYWYNQRWYDYTGTTLEDMKGWGWQKVHHPDHVERIMELSKTIWITNEAFELTFPLRRYDGQYRWFLTRGAPITDENGKIISWIVTNTDIEEQTLNDLRKDEFISIASHELKTPLTIVKGYLQMLDLLLDDSNGDAHVLLSKASQSVNRLNELIAELLDVSKIKLGKLNYRISPFDFNSMVAGTVESMQMTSPGHTIIMTGSVSQALTGDQDRLQQVVVNLLTNAIKYSPGSNKVFIDIEQQDDFVKVSVRDTGIGIAKDDLPKIFDKYHRLDEHAVHFQGLGIGLFISYEIIERHHGRLWAESEPGVGSTFCFTLPLAKVESKL